MRSGWFMLVCRARLGKRAVAGGQRLKWDRLVPNNSIDCGGSYSCLLVDAAKELKPKQESQSMSWREASCKLPVNSQLRIP